jgi:hypothetical protein
MAGLPLPAMLQAQPAGTPPHMKERAMSIQTLRTAGNGGKGRQVVGLVGGLALGAVVLAAIVVGRSAEQAHPTETAVVSSGQTIHSSNALPADPLGGLAEQMVIQRRLEDAAQANVMGGMAERMLLQAQAVTAQPSDVWACGTSPQRTAC